MSQVLVLSRVKCYLVHETNSEFSIITNMLFARIKFLIMTTEMEFNMTVKGKLNKTSIKSNHTVHIKA
jgi:hypothetical protein